MTEHTNTRSVSTDPGRFFPASVAHDGITFIRTGKLGYLVGLGTAVAEYDDPSVDGEPRDYHGRVWADIDGNVTPE